MGSFISKVTSRGQVTLPLALREAEGITEEDYVAMKKIGKYIVITKLEDRMDEIFESFSKEAKNKNITKEDLLADLEKIRHR